MSNQRILFFDFESYYDSEYSLSKMAPPNYIIDPRFEPIGCSFKDGDQPAVYVDGPDIPEYVRRYDSSATTTVAFNALFDNCILAWRYGFIPAKMVCTMRMAVALRGHLLRSASLASVGRCLGVGVKGTTIEGARGKHRADIIADADFYRAYQAYANNDNEMNHDIFYKLLPEWPHAERRIMDRVLRCAVEPAFVCDTTMLSEHLKELAADKARMIRLAAGAKEEDLDAESMFPEQDQDALDAFATSLRSNVRFEALLKGRGVDIVYKTSITNPEVQIPAFAKTDEFMSDLLEHEDPIVQSLAAARLGLRSTIEETRGRRIHAMAVLPWENYRRGNEFYSQYSLPIPLKYAAAHTHRLGGDWKLNFQNLPVGRGVQKSKLRKSLCAPPGYKVVVADKAQIECRINAWLCGQHDLLHLFETGGDPYSVLASYIFGFTVDKNIHKTERFIGKSGELGLGFRCGAAKFYNMVVRQARNLGMDVKELLKVWTPELAQKSVNTYRDTHGAIEQAWRQLDVILKTAWVGQTLPVKFGPCVIGNSGGSGYVEGPSGLRMNYANPREEYNMASGFSKLWYDYGKRRHKMHGGVMLENIVQFLARINTMHDALRIGDRGYRFVLQEHDALAFIVPDDKVTVCKAVVQEEMTRAPSWGKGIPLAVEISHGQTYGDAK